MFSTKYYPAATLTENKDFVINEGSTSKISKKIQFLYKSFNSDLKPLQKTYKKAELTLSDAIRGISSQKHSHEVSLESIENRGWYQELCCSYEIFNNYSQKYLLIIIPVSNRTFTGMTLDFTRIRNRCI